MDVANSLILRVNGSVNQAQKFFRHVSALFHPLQHPSFYATIKLERRRCQMNQETPTGTLFM